jgi:hypothetical protein
MVKSLTMSTKTLRKTKTTRMSLLLMVMRPETIVHLEMIKQLLKVIGCHTKN